MSPMTFHAKFLRINYKKTRRRVKHLCNSTLFYVISFMSKTGQCWRWRFLFGYSPAASTFYAPCCVFCVAETRDFPVRDVAEVPACIHSRFHVVIITTATAYLLNIYTWITYRDIFALQTFVVFTLELNLLNIHDLHCCRLVPTWYRPISCMLYAFLLNLPMHVHKP